MTKVFEQLTHTFQKADIAFQHVQHDESVTGATALIAANLPGEIAVKALLLKCDNAFVMCALNVARRLDSKPVKQAMQSSTLRFATPTELMEVTTLIPGAVPPFGHPFFPIPLFVDSAIAEQERVAFSAGSLTDTLILATSDYLQISSGKLISISKPNVLPMPPI